MKIKALLLMFVGFAQLCLSLRVGKRLLSTASGVQLRPAPASYSEPLAVIVPVLNEYKRLTSCLEGLLNQRQAIAEILIVDGGSCDGTQQLVEEYARYNARIRLIDASPIPPGWNGKAWGLHTGLQQISTDIHWILTLDADVYPMSLLTSSLLEQARKAQLDALSIATLQDITGFGQGLLHPSLLTTLVYRFGAPGRAIHKVSEVQANGQCFLFQRQALEMCGGFAITRTSLCEDVTIARALVHAGHAVGFYEARELISVRMYETWRETWQNWPRSLPMYDHFSRGETLLGLLEVVLVQALPLPLFLLLIARHTRSRWLLLLNACNIALRIGVLFGTARAYRYRPWSYWLSPLCDLPVACKLGISALRRRHTWRGRTIVRGGGE